MTYQEFEEQTLSLTQPMYRLASVMLRNEVDKEDAVQTCILRAWEKLPQLKDESRFRPWLMQILVNCCRVMLRRRKNEVLVDTLPYDPPAPPPNAELRLALDAMPDKDRLILALHYLEGMDCKELSAALRLSPSAVKSRLNRSRKNLKQLMQEDIEE